MHAKIDHTDNLYSFVDLFAGCGGFSLGLCYAGLTGRFAIERDIMAFQTFRANFLDSPPASINFKWPIWLAAKAWDIEMLLEQHWGDLVSLRGQVDVLAGGPPCQGFSFAGRRVEADPRNSLFERYVDVVNLLQPQALVLENVPGMRIAHSKRRARAIGCPEGDSAASASFYDKLVASLESAGYHVDAMLIDCSRFGVPQRRSRLIVIGLRKEHSALINGGVSRAFELLEQARVVQLTELGLTDTVSAECALSDLETAGHELVASSDPELSRPFKEVDYRHPKTHYQEIMHRGCFAPMDSMRLARHREDVRDRFASILAECRQGVTIDKDRLKKYGLKKHRIYPMASHAPAPTVTTLPDDILHYSEPRILTVRETARLQSFPDWFKFKGRFTTGGNRRAKECPRYTQVGNAVPPLLARAIGIALRQLLDEVAIAQPSCYRDLSKQASLRKC